LWVRLIITEIMFSGQTLDPSGYKSMCHLGDTTPGFIIARWIRRRNKDRKLYPTKL
jgi:hypothetical protein